MSRIHPYEPGTRKLLYVAGPLRSDKGDDGMFRNTLAARAVMLELMRMRFSVICPHTNSFLCGGALLDDYDWLDADREMIARCDGVVFIAGWQQSEGARCEREFAEMNGIPCFDWTSPAHREFLEKAAKSPEKMVDLLDVKNG